MTNAERLLHQSMQRESESLAIDDIERAGFRFDDEFAMRSFPSIDIESIHRLAAILLMEFGNDA